MNRKTALVLAAAVILVSALKASSDEKIILIKDPLVEVVKISDNQREYYFKFKAAKKDFKGDIIDSNLGLKGMYMWGFVRNIPGVKDFIIRPKSIYIEKEASAQWEQIEPRVVKIIIKAYSDIC